MEIVYSWKKKIEDFYVKHPFTKEEGNYLVGWNNVTDKESITEKAYHLYGACLDWSRILMYKHIEIIDPTLEGDLFSIVIMLNFHLLLNN